MFLLGHDSNKRFKAVRSIRCVRAGTHLKHNELGGHVASLTIFRHQRQGGESRSHCMNCIVGNQLASLSDSAALEAVVKKHSSKIQSKMSAPYMRTRFLKVINLPLTAIISMLLLFFSDIFD